MTPGPMGRLSTPPLRRSATRRHSWKPSSAGGGGAGGAETRRAPHAIPAVARSPKNAPMRRPVTTPSMSTGTSRSGGATSRTTIAIADNAPAPVTTVVRSSLCATRGRAIAARARPTERRRRTARCRSNRTPPRRSPEPARWSRSLRRAVRLRHPRRTTAEQARYEQPAARAGEQRARSSSLGHARRRSRAPRGWRASRGSPPFFGSGAQQDLLDRNLELLVRERPGHLGDLLHRVREVSRRAVLAQPPPDRPDELVVELGAFSQDHVQEHLLVHVDHKRVEHLRHTLDRAVYLTRPHAHPTAVEVESERP